MEKITNEPDLQVPTFEVLNDRTIYINLLRMYFGFHKKIPSIKGISRIDLSRFKQWLINQQEYMVLTCYSKEQYQWDKKNMQEVDAIYLLENEIMVDLEQDDDVTVAFSGNQRDTAQKIINEARKFRIRKKNAHEIRMVIGSSDGLETTRIRLSKPKLKVELHYNDDLFQQHYSIIKCLNKKDKSGIMLFYGEPGTGKSTYIRYLIHYLQKDVIFMSPSMASNLDSPSLTRLLVNNANAIFIIEDAEELLVSREKERNSSISMLLNLTDGLLGDSLGIQIIATFNTHINNIDKALLRKGRLNSLYEFKPLCVEKSKNLLEHNGISNYIVNKPMTLAELFNISQEDFHYKTERQAIGFFGRAV